MPAILLVGGPIFTELSIIGGPRIIGLLIMLACYGLTHIIQEGKDTGFNDIWPGNL